MLYFLDFDGSEQDTQCDNEVDKIFTRDLPKLLTEISPNEEEVDTSLLQILNFEGLMCPICMDPFVNPRILSCYHVFCRACLLDVILSSHEHDQVVCSVCRKRNRLEDIKIFDMLARLMKEMYELALQLRQARTMMVILS